MYSSLIKLMVAVLYLVALVKAMETVIPMIMTPGHPIQVCGLSTCA